MITNFVYPSSCERVGGVTVLYEFAQALARRGHEVHFIHGPAWKGRVDRLDQVQFDFDASVQQHIVDRLDDASLAQGDVVVGMEEPRLGQPVVVVQGFRLVGPRWDAGSFRARLPKICVATWLLDVGRSYGVPEEQLMHVPVGLDHKLFATRTSADRRAYDVALLYHPSPAKGWDVSRQVLESLIRRRPQLRAVVFAMDRTPPDSLPDNVDVVVGLDHRRLSEEVFNQARVMIQASFHEGFGLTAVEAMACGAALVTTDCGGSRDYAAHRQTAMVCPAGDVGGLVDAAEELLDDAGLRADLAGAGARLVRVFDWDRSGALLEQALERYLADPARYQRPPGTDRSEDYHL